MVGAISSSAPPPVSLPAQATKAAVGGVDSDGDNDGTTEASESAAAQAQEAAKPSTPTNPNLGNNLNTTA